MRRFAPRLVSIHSNQHSWALRVLVGTAMVVLVAAGLTAPQWISTTSKAAAASAPTVTDFTRPDRATAFALASTTSHRVEVTGERTETSTLWANPDGSVTVDAAQAPIRVHKADGSWSPVDVSLRQNADATWSPASVVNQFTISNGGGTAGTWQPLVTTVDSAATRIGWLWQGALPTPTIAGATATFHAVLPGVDLVVSASPVGFEQSFVLTARPDGPVALPLAISSGAGLTLSEGADGAYRLVDPSGATVADASVATVWDAKQAPAPIDQPQQIAVPTDASVASADVVAPGQSGTSVSLDQVAYNAAATGSSTTPSASLTLTPSATAPAATTVDTTLPTTNADVSSVLAAAPAKDHTLVIAPDAAMLADPSTVYPVTIDPAINLTPTWDSDVNSGFPTSHYETATSLYVGQGGGGQTFRSYLTFDFTSLYQAVPSSAQVQSAQLKMYEVSASSCTATPWEMRQSTTPPTQVTWNTMPTPLAATIAATTTSAKGLAGCPTDWSSMDITNWIKALVGAGAPTRPAVVLKGQTETGSNTVHQFASSEYSTYNPITQTYTYYPPTMSVTYDSPPVVPTSVQVSPAGSVDPVTTAISTTSAPVFGANVSDPDSSQVAAVFGLYSATSKNGPWTLVGSATGSSVSSGGRSVITVDKLSNGALDPALLYKIQAGASDGLVTAPAQASVFQLFRVDATAPSAVTIPSGCSGITLSGWQATQTTPNYCTVTATDPTPGTGVSLYRYSIDNSDLDQTTTGTITFNNGYTGWHTITVAAQDNTGNLGPISTFSFGIGNGGFEQLPSTSTLSTGLVTAAPIPSTTASTVNLRTSFATGSTATFSYWNPTAGTWQNIPLPDLTFDDGTHPGTTSINLTGSGSYKTTGNVYLAGNLLAAQDQVLRVHACITNTTTCTGDASFTVDHVGNSGASGSLGPVGVSYTTGNMSMSATDVTLSTARGGLGVDRSYNSALPTVSGEFGKGWNSSLDGSVERLVDQGSQVLIYDNSNSPSSFTFNGSTYTATNSTLGQTLTSTGSPPTSFTLTESDAVTTTTFGPVGTLNPSPTASNPNVYHLSGDSAPGADTTSVLYDGDATYPLPVSELAAPPSGHLSDCPVDATGVPIGSWPVGCRSLQFIPTHAPNNTPRQIATVRYWYTGTAVGPASSVDVSCYVYDAAGYLTQQWDPRKRIGQASVPTCASFTPLGGTTTPPPVRVSYTYNETASTATPTGVPAGTSVPASTLYALSDNAGTAPWFLGYDNNARLTKVTRTHTGGGTNTYSIAYGVVTNGTAVTGCSTTPDLTPAATSAWGQTAAPTSAVELFGPAGTATDCRTGTIYAFDGQGNLLNTADYSGTGPTGWGITTTQYDSYGNTVWTLTAANRALALAPVSNATLTSLGIASWGTAQRADILGTSNVYDPSNGSNLTDTYGPLHLITAPGSTNPSAGRTHTHTLYGTVAYPLTTPTNWATQAPQYQPASTTETGWLLATGTDIDPRETDYAYSLQANPNPTDDAAKAGWTYNTPLRTTTVMADGHNIVSETVLDANGNTIQQRQPSDAGNGSTAATRTTTYYNSGAHNPSACTSDLWFGQVCTISPASQPSGTPLPTTSYQATANYDAYLRPLSATQSTPSGSYKTSSVTYDDGGLGNNQVTSQMTGNAAGTALPAVTTSYDTLTGLPATATAGTSNLTTVYDDFGQQTSFTDADGATSTTTYNATTDQVTSTTLNQPSGGVPATVTTTTTYGYNSTTDLRGLPTKITPSDMGATISGIYNADGALVSQSVPLSNGISSDALIQQTAIDPAGQTTSLTYKESTDNGTTGTAWLSDTRSYTVHGQVATESGTNLPWNRAYGYDYAGRLTAVSEQRTAPGSTCQTRTYGYDGTSGAGLNGNRTSQSTFPPDAFGNCALAPATTPVSATAYSYDSADQLQPTGAAAGLAYDAWGRTTSLPAALGTSSTVSTATYYINDYVNTLTSAGLVHTYSLDPAGRIRTDQVTGSTSSTTTNHYSGPSGDSPVSSSTKVGTTTTLTRAIPGLDGTAFATTISSGATSSIQLNLLDIHGDAIRSTPLTATSSPSGTLTDADEFGNVRNPNLPTASFTNGPKYGWLGSQLRSADTPNGVVLMGARLYSPVLGRFLSRDSFYGGNETSYGYPLDPIMNSDLSGTMNAKTRKLFRHIADFIGKALDLIGLIPFLGWICGFICDFLIAAAGLVEAVLYFAIGEVGKGWAAIVGVGLGLLGGRALKKIFGEIKPAWKRGAPAPIMKVLKASGLDRVFAMITMYITGFLDWVDEKSHHKKVA